MFRGNVNCHSYLCCGTNHACIIPIPWLENVDQVYVINSAIIFSKASFLWSDEWCLVMVSRSLFWLYEYIVSCCFHIQNQTKISRWNFPFFKNQALVIPWVPTDDSSHRISFFSKVVIRHFLFIDLFRGCFGSGILTHAFDPSDTAAVFIFINIWSASVVRKDWDVAIVLHCVCSIVQI